MGHGHFLNLTERHEHFLNSTGPHKPFLKSTVKIRTPPSRAPILYLLKSPSLGLVQSPIFVSLISAMPQSITDLF